MLETSWIAVFLMGLLSSGHCIGMCGGFISAFSLQLPAKKSLSLFQLSYNLGRISSYSLAGLLAGAVGEMALLANHLLPIQAILQTLASLLLIMFGLYFIGFRQLLAQLEKLGNSLWRYLQPFTYRLLPPNTLPKAYLLGMLWGWLPCGLVYSVLSLALVSGSAWQGANLMLAFGLGTLPSLLLAGSLVQRLNCFLARQSIRAIMGTLLIGFGLFGLTRLTQLDQLIVGWCHHVF